MTSKNILIADQDLNNLQYFFSYISGFAHYNIMNAVSVAMALQIQKEKKLDLIIIDWLTVLNSEKLYPNFWEDLTHHHTLPLILMTHTASSVLESNPELAVFVRDTIRKPFNAMNLREKMDRVLNIPPPHRMEPPLAQPSLDTEQKDTLSLASILQRQKEIIDFEKEMMIAERINLHQLREELRKEIAQLEDERKKLEDEKKDLVKQQAYFTEEENTLISAQIKLQQDLDNFELEKKLFLQQQTELEKAWKQFYLEKEAFSNEKKNISQKPPHILRKS